MADPFHWKRILAATDFSPTGENAVRTAASLAGRGRSSLAVVYVAERPPMFSLPLPGGVAEKVVRHAEGPVLVVPTAREGEPPKQPVSGVAPQGEVTQ